MSFLRPPSSRAGARYRRWVGFRPITGQLLGMSSSDENPIPRLDTCCGCIQLKMGVLILCVLQMIASAFMILLIGSYILFGSA